MCFKSYKNQGSSRHFGYMNQHDVVSLHCDQCRVVFVLTTGHLTCFFVYLLMYVWKWKCFKMYLLALQKSLKVRYSVSYSCRNGMPM